MSMLRWGYHLVEKPFCGQFRAMSWQRLEGDTDVPELVDLLTGHVRVPEGISVVL